MNIAVVTAHPDDAEFLAGGTIIKYREKGHNVTIIICTNGNVGHPTLPKDDIASLRWEEAKESAKVLDADVICLGYDDEFMPDTKESRLKVMNALRGIKADVVFTHYPHDHVNPDHRVVSRITTDMCFLQQVKNIETENPETEKPAALYYMDVLSGGDFKPTDYVDISDVFDQKKEALSKHKSQQEWMKRTGTAPDISRNTELQFGFRGMQSHCMYAEAFIFENRYPRAKVKNLLPQYV